MKNVRFSARLTQKSCNAQAPELPTRLGEATPEQADRSISE
jgi:hypothetical protein